MRQSYAFLVASVTVFALSACKKKEPPPAPAPVAQPAPTPAKPVVAAPAAPAPVAAPPAAPAPAISGPKWVQKLPQRAPTAKVGDLVWATVAKPEDEYSKWFGVLKVEAITGNTVTLLGLFNAKHENVPAAVLHPVTNAALKPGDVATMSMHGGARIGIVAKIEGNKTHMKYDFVGQPADGPTDHAFPLVPGVAPLAWVHYKGEGFNTSRYKGLVIAMEGDTVWILSGSGRVEVVAKNDVKPLTIAKDYKVGQKVFAYIPAYTEVPVTKVLKPGFMYEIVWKVGGKDVPKKYFFHDLTEQL